MAEASIESFITASADHQDASFRLVQYACRLLGSLHVGTKRTWLYAVSNSLDASRILTRTFGIVYAARAALSAHARLNDLLADVSLCLYHPCETAYWLLLVTGSQRAELRRTFSRLSSLFGLLWGVLHGASVYQRLCSLREAASEADADDDGAAAVLADEITRLRRLLCKLALDSVLSMHWALDHRNAKLSDWQVGLLGTASAMLGLRLQWGAHVEALQVEDDDESEEEGEEEDDEEEEDDDDNDENDAHSYTPLSLDPAGSATHSPESTTGVRRRANAPGPAD